MNINTIAAAYGSPLYDPSSKLNKKPEASKSQSTPKEVVDFSDTSMSMQKLKDVVNQAPEIRIPIVEKIQEKIKNNNYPIDRTLDTVLERMLKQKIL